MELLIAKPTVTEFCDLVAKSGLCGYDTEHDPIEVRKDFRPHLWGGSFSTPVDGKLLSFYETDLDRLDQIYANLPEDAVYVAHNAKHDLKVLYCSNVIRAFPKYVRDTMIAVNVLNENIHENQLGLKFIVKTKFKHKMMEYEEAVKFGRDSKEFGLYAIDDAYWALRLYLYCRDRLKEEGCDQLYDKIICEVQKMFAEVEFTGMRFDVEAGEKMYDIARAQRDKVQREIYQELGSVNLKSPKQLQNRIFNELNYPTAGVRKTDAGQYSTDDKTLELLAKKYDKPDKPSVFSKLLTYRKFQTHIQNFVLPLSIRAAEDKESRIHCDFWLTSKTGRTRSSNPNLQNIPVFQYTDKEIENALKVRNCFCARPGHTLICADLSQIELRLWAHVSKDPTLLKAYRDWKCQACNTTGTDDDKILHSCPNCGAAENEDILKNPELKNFWHGLNLHRITCDGIPACGGNYTRAKSCNFAVVYLASAWKLHNEYPDLSIEGWQEIIDQFFQLYPNVKSVHEYAKGILETTGEFREMFGRKRRLKQDLAKGHSFKHLWNTAVNFLIQSPAAHYIMLCAIKMREDFISSKHWLDTIFPVNFVHDELVLEVRNDHLQYAKEKVQYHLENSCKFLVPIRADVKTVQRWGDAK